MAKKSNGGSDGQPTMEKLASEGVSIRRCISYEGLGEYGGRGSKSTPAKGGGLASLARKGY
jgi:hypothetical protein